MEKIIFNFLLYFIVTLFLLFIRKRIGLSIMIWAFFSLFSFFSILIWEFGIYQTVMVGFIKNKISFMPFIFIFLIMAIFLSPLTKFNEEKINNISIPNELKWKFVLYPSVVLGLLIIAQMLPYLSYSLANEFGNIYKTGKADSVGIFPHYLELLFTLYSILYPFLAISFFLILIRKKKKNIVLILLGISAFIPSILYGIGGASRGMLFFKFLDLVIIFFLFKDKLSSKVKFRIMSTLVIILFLLISISLLITTSRFSENFSAIFSILRYFGESFLNFNLIYFDRVDSHLNGQRFFPDIFGMLNGSRDFLENANDSKWYFTRLLGVPSYLFKTLPGDLYLEFGYIGTILFALISSCFGFRYVKTDPDIPFYRLLIILFYCQLCLGGVFDFVKGGHDSFYQIIGLVLIYFFFRLDFQRLVLLKR